MIAPPLNYAFPWVIAPFDGKDGEMSGGMTIREYVAIAAMQGLYAGYYASESGVRAVENAARICNTNASGMIAQAAVQAADSLLAELAKEPK